MTHYSLPLLLTVVAAVSFYLPSSHAVGVRPKQSAGVKGLLTCDGKPASRVRVKLYDKDTCKRGLWGGLERGRG